MIHPRILALVLAGGKGERLFPLTVFRSKPSVPFGGRYRIVDFVLSNLVYSQIYSIYLLVQYKSQSLIEHVRQNWILSSRIGNHFVTVVPPQMRLGPEWFQGTADIYQVTAKGCQKPAVPLLPAGDYGRRTLSCHRTLPHMC